MAKTEEVSDISKKVLKSGLVDKHMAEMMERWGYLPDGASKLVPADAIEAQFTKLADELDEELEKRSKVKETSLDLATLRWPKTVDVFRYDPTYGTKVMIGYRLTALVDRMGRYYFKPPDVHERWFVPGETFIEYVEYVDGEPKVITGGVLESQTLYKGDVAEAIQVCCDNK